MKVDKKTNKLINTLFDRPLSKRDEIEKSVVDLAVSLIKSTHTDAEYKSLSQTQRHELHIQALNIVKGKKLPVGTVRQYGNYKYVKHSDGWVALSGPKKNKLVDFKAGGKEHSKHVDSVHGKFAETHSTKEVGQSKEDEKVSKEVGKTSRPTGKQEKVDKPDSKLLKPAEWKSRLEGRWRGSVLIGADGKRWEITENDGKDIWAKVEQHGQTITRTLEDFKPFSIEKLGKKTESKDPKKMLSDLGDALKKNGIYKVGHDKGYISPNSTDMTNNNITKTSNGDIVIRLVVDGKKSGLSFNHYTEEKEDGEEMTFHKISESQQSSLHNSIKDAIRKLGIKGDIKVKNGGYQTHWDYDTNYVVVISGGDIELKKSTTPTPYDLLDVEIDNILKGGPGSGRKKGPAPSKEEMQKRIKKVKERLKEAEENGEHMEIVGLRNWLATHDK